MSSPEASGAITDGTIAPPPAAPPPAEAEAEPQKVILIKPPIIVKQLASELSLKPHQLIAELMTYNIFANINQTVEPDIAAKIAENHGFVLEKERREKGAGVHKVEQVVVAPPPPVIERVWVEPVYRTVCEQNWVPAVYRTVTDHIWHERVVRNETERVWVPDQYETRPVDPFGHTVALKKVLVKCGHYEDVCRDVVIKPGYYEDVCRQELVCAGHYENLERQELVAPGHWEVRERCASNDRPIPLRCIRGSTNNASSSLSPSALGSTAANPTMAPFCSDTNTLPPAICCRGNSIASG